MVIIKRQIRAATKVRSVLKGEYGGIRIYRGLGRDIQRTTVLQYSRTKGDHDRKTHRPYSYKPNQFKRKHKVRINVTLIRPNPTEYGYYSINKRRNRVYIYAREEKMLLAELVNKTIGEPINATNYVDTENPPDLYARNNTCFFLMIEMPFYGIKNLVSNLFMFEDDFQNNLFILMKSFSKITGFPPNKITCFAINKTTYMGSHEKYAVYPFSKLFGDRIVKITRGIQEFKSTIMEIDEFNSLLVNLIDEYSKNSKTKNRIIGGPLDELLQSFGQIVTRVEGEEGKEGVDYDREEEVVFEGGEEGGEGGEGGEEEGGEGGEGEEEEEGDVWQDLSEGEEDNRNFQDSISSFGGNKYKKISKIQRKTKRKKQRSKRRKHRSQKKH